MSFEIGKVTAGDPDIIGRRESVTASIVNHGVTLLIWGGLSFASITLPPDKAREFGELLITAADNWRELNSRITQVQQERQRFESDRQSWIQKALRREH